MTKHSRQRDAILDYLHSTRSHPTAETVYENVRENIPNISLGTGFLFVLGGALLIASIVAIIFRKKDLF